MASRASPSPYLLAGNGLAAFLTFTHVFNDAFQAMLPALLPTLQIRFALSEASLALLVAVLAFSSSVMQPVFGALADRFGRRMVGSLGVIACTMLLSLLGTAPTPLVLVGLLLLGGFGSAAFHPSSTSLVGSAAKGRRELATSIFIFGGGIGQALGPIAVLLVIANYGLQYMPWLMIPGLVMGGLMYLLVPPQPRLPRGARPRLFDPGLFLGPVGALCAAGILRTIAWVTFINAMPLWLVTSHGVGRDATLIGLTIGLFTFSGGLGGMLASTLAVRVGRKRLITATMLLALPALYLVLLLPPGSLLYFLAIMLAGGLTNAALPLMVVSAQDLAPQAVATASGMLMGLTWGTAGVLYIFVGLLQEAIGIGPAMRVGYLFLIPAALLALLVLSRQQRRAT
ncbi:MAG: MFS transporter [Deinococcota bacterium]|jgi:FSR family fosmidomycin resistance protein-like MFS transporter|nr:MFS transporter [Deinococcota bacterium]